VSFIIKARCAHERYEYMKRKRSFNLGFTQRPLKRRKGFIGPVMSFDRRMSTLALRRAKRLDALNRGTRGFLGVERKFYDTALTATAIVSPTDCTGAELDPSATSMISTPAQGDSEQNRDGKQIACLYMLWKMLLIRWVL